MDIMDLKAFVMLAETLNFTRSAEALYVSQSTFSRQISRLESEMGLSLFIRSPRSVTLTEYGQVFLPEAKAQIATWENTLRHMEQVKQGLRGSLSIGFLQDNPNDHFPEVLRAYRAAHPNVALTFREYGQGHIVQALNDGEIDLAFTFSEGLGECPNVESRTLERSPIRAVVWEGSPLASRAALSLSDLASEPMVVIGSEVNLYGYQNVMDRCRRSGFSPIIAATANILPSLFMLIEAGLGYAFLPESARRIAPQGIRFLPILDCQDELATVLAWQADCGNACLSGFLQVASEMLII